MYMSIIEDTLTNLMNEELIGWLADWPTTYLPTYLPTVVSYGSWMDLLIHRVASDNEDLLDT